VRGFGLLKHQHRETGEAQLAGEEQTNRAGTGNDNVVDSCVVHELLLCGRSTGAARRVSI